MNTIRCAIFVLMTVTVFTPACVESLNQTRPISIRDVVKEPKDDQAMILEERGTPDMAWRRANGTDLWVYCANPQWPTGLLFNKRGELIRRLHGIDSAWCEGKLSS